MSRTSSTPSWRGSYARRCDAHQRDSRSRVAGRGPGGGRRRCTRGSRLDRRGRFRSHAPPRARRCRWHRQSEPYECPRAQALAGSPTLSSRMSMAPAIQASSPVRRPFEHGQRPHRRLDPTTSCPTDDTTDISSRYATRGSLATRGTAPHRSPARPWHTLSRWLGNPAVGGPAWAHAQPVVGQSAGGWPPLTRHLPASWLPAARPAGQAAAKARARARSRAERGRERGATSLRRSGSGRRRRR